MIHFNVNNRDVLTAKESKLFKLRQPQEDGR